MTVDDLINLLLKLPPDCRVMAKQYAGCGHCNIGDNERWDVQGVVEHTNYVVIK